MFAKSSLGHLELFLNILSPPLAVKFCNTVHRYINRFDVCLMHRMVFNTICYASAGLTCFSCMFRDWTWLLLASIDAAINLGCSSIIAGWILWRISYMLERLHRLHRSPVCCIAARVSMQGRSKRSRLWALKSHHRCQDQERSSVIRVAISHFDCMVADASF